MFGRMICGVAASAMLLGACAATAQTTTATSASAPSPDAAALIAATSEHFSAQRLSDNIRYLSDDALLGRFPGKIGEEMTLAYLQKQYEDMGLQPGGPNGSWLQDVDLLRLTPVRPAVISWTGRDGVSHPVEGGMVLRAGPGDGHVKMDHVPIVFAGYGVVAPERQWDDYGAQDLTGKVVIVLNGQPAAFGDDPNFYGSSTHKMNEALKRGAVGVITLYPSPGGRGMRGARPRMTIVGAHETPIQGVMTLDPIQAMATSMGHDVQEVLTMARAGGRFKAHDTGLTLDFDIAETPEVIHSHNLLAKIPGSQRPDEYLIYSAHWDHVGTAADPNADGDYIYNGAWDNASGTSGVLEMARAFKNGPPPERTVVFLHVTAEEQGLLGSEWYAAHPVYPLAKTAADINIDMLPFTPATRSIAIFGPGKSTLEDDLARLAAAQGRPGGVVGDGEPAQGFYYRSDHFNFAVGGVPALMPWTGVDFVQGGEAVGRPYYQAQMATYYHNLEDEWRADYDFTAALQNLELLYQLGQKVADSRDWPQWKPTAEFAALRHETDAQRR